MLHRIKCTKELQCYTEPLQIVWLPFKYQCPKQQEHLHQSVMWTSQHIVFHVLIRKRSVMISVGDYRVGPDVNVNLKIFFFFKLAVLFFSSFLKWIQAPPLQTRVREKRDFSVIHYWLEFISTLDLFFCSGSYLYLTQDVPHYIFNMSDLHLKEIARRERAPNHRETTMCTK